MESIAKILIVEDNAVVAADIKARVQRMGYTVTQCATRGQSAIDSVENAPPNLILMDIKLKGEMSGIEAASSIRTNHDIPLIYLTSYTDEATLEQAKLTDPFGYIVKPFEDKELRTVIEISLHKHKMERQLKESEQWLKTTLTSIGDGVITTDMEGCVTFMNPVAEELTGWSFREAAGKQVSMVFHIIHEGTRELVENPVTKVIETGKIIGLANHTLLIAKDGREMPIKDSGSPIVLNDNENLGVVLVFQDDTKARLAEKKLRESEEKYKQMFLDNKAIKIVIDSSGGEIIEANEAAFQFYQYPQLLGMNINDINMLNPDQIQKEMNDAMNQERSHFNFVHKISTGEKKDVEVYSGPIVVNGKTQLFSIIHDISERRKLESQLQQAQKMEAIGTLAGGIAHDFNNILGIILGYAEMAKEDAVPGTNQEKDLENVLVGADRAKSLVQQILAFSRQSQVEPIQIKIQPLIKEGLKMLRSSIPATISITEDIAPDSGVILVDPTQIHQILMNLGTNAYHAMEGSGGVLSVTLKSTFIGPDEKELLLHVNSGDYVEFTVSDTGAGMGPDVIEKIFDPYFTTKEIGKGTGMGLAIIYGIVKGYGGTITVESQIGKGTTFHVYFPVVEEGALPDKKEPKDIPIGTERILFVDDEQLLAEMGKVMLERLGYHVTVRRSSLEALETFQNTPNAFDLVITDQTMHGMTGYDLARRMMQIKPDIPIVLCTGYSSLIDEESAKSIGIKEFALKPLTKEVIARLIRKVLGEVV